MILDGKGKSEPPAVQPLVSLNTRQGFTDGQVTDYLSSEKQLQQLFGFLCNSLRLIRLFSLNSKISKIEGKINNPQMVTHLSTIQAHGCLNLFILTGLTFGSCWYCALHKYITLGSHYPFVIFLFFQEYSTMECLCTCYTSCYPFGEHLTSKDIRLVKVYANSSGVIPYVKESSV